MTFLTRLKNALLIILLKCIRGLLHHYIIIKGIEYLRIDSEIVPNHGLPKLAPVTHRHIAFHNFGNHLTILFILLVRALYLWQKTLDPDVQLLLRMLILKILQIFLATRQLLLVPSIINLILLQAQPTRYYMVHQFLRHVLH